MKSRSRDVLAAKGLLFGSFMLGVGTNHIGPLDRAYSCYSISSPEETINEPLNDKVNSILSIIASSG